MLFRKNLLFFTLGLLMASFLCPSLSAWDKNTLIFLADAQLLGGYSKVSGNDGLLSTDDQWSLSPTLTLVPDKLYWINLYNGTYNRSGQVLAQEEGGQSIESSQSHSLTTAFKYNVDKTWMLRPLFFVDWIYVVDTTDESFGEGLYDYRDVGGGLESSWTLAQTKTRLDEVRAGFRYFDRQYQNYESLISQFDPRSQIEETREKDFNGYKFNLSFESQSAAEWSWGLEGIFLWKDFKDKRTIDANGIRSADDRRQDWLEYVNVYVSHPLASPEWSLRLDGQVSANISNLDFYDTHNTSTLTDDSFIPDYFDYISFMVKPTLAWQREIEKGKMLIASASYAFSAQYYTGRKTQDPAGAYQNDEEQDLAHTFSAQLSFPLTPNISWVSVANYSIVDSNQEYEAFYLYSYDSWSAMTGFSFKY